MISSNEIRKDDFTLILPNHYFVKLDLVIPKTINDQGSIEFRIIFINSNGIEEKPCEQPEIKMIPVPATIFMSIYTKLVEAIISRDNDLSQTIISENRTRPDGSIEIDYPNEYTMWHLNWYKHSYLFLQPFQSYNGAKLRLSYLINELIEDRIIDPKFIEKDPEIENYPVILSDRLDWKK